MKERKHTDSMTVMIFERELNTKKKKKNHKLVIQYDVNGLCQHRD